MMATPSLSLSLQIAAPAVMVSPGSRRHVLGAVGALAVLVAVAVGTVVPRLVAEREQSVLRAIQARQTALAQGRAEVIATWIAGVEAPAERLTSSPAVRLFAQEMRLTARDGLLAEALRDQLPYMQLVVEDFARQAGLSGAGLLGPSGEWLVADGQVRLSAAQLQALAAVPAGERLLRLTGEERPELIIGVPVTALTEDRDDSRTVTARLIMIVDVEARLGTFLGDRGLDAPGEHAALLLDRPTDGSLLLDSQGVVTSAPRDWERLHRHGGALQTVLGPRGTELLMVAAKVQDLDGSVVQWVDREDGLAPAREFARLAWSIAGLLGAALLALVAALAWSLEGRHQRALAIQYRRLADQLEGQRRLLDDITGALPEMIGLKDASGRYRFVNRAFCLALGRSPEQILERTDLELFGEAGSAILAAYDEEALRTGAAQGLDERLPIGGRERIVHLAKVPFADAAEQGTGILAITTDVTELALERARREQLQLQTVEAFTRAVELADPWLLGHTRRMRVMATALGRSLGLDNATVTTIDLAAALSQIGKLFVPRELLLKAERLEPAEISVMRTHLDHAIRVLGDVELDLPVVDALAEMHERLDGSGYPRGLEGEAIGMAGRILAVADVFCARTAPRSYRDAIDAPAALGILETHLERYDPAVIQALRAHLEQGSARRVGDFDQFLTTTG